MDKFGCLLVLFIFILCYLSNNCLSATVPLAATDIPDLEDSTDKFPFQVEFDETTENYGADYDQRTTTRSEDYLDSDNSENGDNSENDDEGEIRNEFINDCRCGSANPSLAYNSLAYIINGSEATPLEYPWLVVLVRRDSFNRRKVFCSATIINDRYLITAAHCIKTLPVSKIEAFVNAHNISKLGKSGDFGSRINITRLIPHEGWNKSTVEHDIGLIELAEPLDFNFYNVSPVCLPEKANEEYLGVTGTVVGWGYKRTWGWDADVLNKVKVPILTHKECTSNTNYGDKILPSMLCAGLPEGGKDACINDSGGPLTIDNNRTKKNSLVGLVSWGYSCAKPKYPGVYTRVSKYLDWIAKKASKGRYCKN